jgi:hypothetical protein
VEEKSAELPGRRRDLGHTRATGIWLPSCVRVEAIAKRSTRRRRPPWRIPGPGPRRRAADIARRPRPSPALPRRMLRARGCRRQACSGRALDRAVTVAAVDAEVSGVDLMAEEGDGLRHGTSLTGHPGRAHPPEEQDRHAGEQREPGHDHAPRNDIAAGGEKRAHGRRRASRGIGEARWRARATLPVDALDLMVGVLHEVAALLRRRGNRWVASPIYSRQLSLSHTTSMSRGARRRKVTPRGAVVCWDRSGTEPVHRVAAEGAVKRFS